MDTRAVGAFEGLDLPEGQWTDVGGPVHYVEWPGPSGGPTFVCVHGLGGSYLNWALVAPGLARHGRVVALDLSGFGLTPPAGRGSSINANWKLLHGFLDAIRAAPAILVGNSMGGMLSLIEAAHAPEKVTALILVDAAFPRARSMAGHPGPRVVAGFLTFGTSRMGAELADRRARRLGPERLVQQTMDLCAFDPPSMDPGLLNAHVEMARARESFAYAPTAFMEGAGSIVKAGLRPERYRELVRRVRQPALVIHGTHDRLVPLPMAREAAAEHANWELVVIPRTGHIPMMERPQEWLEVVDRWLSHGRVTPSKR